MTELKRIAILTGGGDVPGLNAAIKAVAQRCHQDGVELVGIRRGWQGMVDLEPDGDARDAEILVPLTAQRVRTIDRTGGTMLHSSRTNPAKMKEKVLPPGFDKDAHQPNPNGTWDVSDRVMKTLARLGVDALTVIGGDDTLSYAARLDSLGWPTVGIPKTMDNDVSGTEYCIGFSTAVTRSVDMITQLRTPAGSHERIAIVELFGRNSGQTALRIGYLSGADRTLICEVPFDVDRVCEYAMADQDASPSGYSMIVVSEGAHPIGGEVIQSGEPDAYGHRKLGGVGVWLAEEIRHRTGRETLNQHLGYLMRAGSPDSLDRIVAMNFGHFAYELLRKGRHGNMTALVGGCYVATPLAAVNAGARPVDVETYYDAEKYLPRMQRVEGQPMFLS
jgi:6-phosphofructokinase 1